MRRMDGRSPLAATAETRSAFPGDVTELEAANVRISLGLAPGFIYSNLDELIFETSAFESLK